MVHESMQIAIFPAITAASSTLTHIQDLWQRFCKMTDYSNIPDYDSLPPVKGMPKGCAWGVFDKDGKKDKFGTINLITPEVVKEAVKEVKEGVSVSLKCVSCASYLVHHSTTV
jgi:hypothetical protein